MDPKLQELFAKNFPLLAKSENEEETQEEFGGQNDFRNAFFATKLR